MAFMNSLEIRWRVSTLFTALLVVIVSSLGMSVSLLMAQIGKDEASKEGEVSTLISQAVARVNEIRQGLGLAPVVLDPELSRGCKLHARYLSINRNHPGTKGLGAHEESPNLSGYTPAGQRAGRASVISYSSTPTAAVDSWMATLYHRTPILRPNLKRIGFGFEDSIEVMDVSSLIGPDDIPVAYPSPEQSGVPTHFSSGEIPNPIPGGASGLAGYPITLQFPTGWKIVNVSAQLIDAEGNKVPVHLSDPEHPALSTHPQGGVCCLLPVKPLSQATVYKVTIWANVNSSDFMMRWTFATVGATAPTADIEPPALFNPKAITTSLSKESSTVMLRAIATGNVKGVTAVQAEITRPDGRKETVNLKRKSSSAIWEAWEEVFIAPAVKKLSTYKVTFLVQDGANHPERSSEATFTVEDVQAPPLKPTTNPRNVVLSSDGVTLAIGENHTVKLLDVQTGEWNRTLMGHNAWVNFVAFSSDGKTLAAGGTISEGGAIVSNEVSFWNAQTGELLRTLVGSGDWGTFAFSPDGKTLAIGGARRVNLRDAQTGELLRTLPGHNGRVYSVAFSPDGKNLASGSDDNTICLWDAQTGELLRTMRHNDRVYSIAFSPDGKTLTSISSDGTVRPWSADTERLLRKQQGKRTRTSGK